MASRLLTPSAKEGHTSQCTSPNLVLPEIKEADPRSDQFAAKGKVLKDLVEHHAEEEESEMFPRVRKLMPRGDLLRLGQDLTRARASLRAAAGNGGR